MNVFRSGECESLKATVHGAIEALAVVCLGYSVGAMVARRKLEPHLVRNALFYAVVVAVEHLHVRHHLDRR